MGIQENADKTDYPELMCRDQKQHVRIKKWDTLLPHCDVVSFYEVLQIFRTQDVYISRTPAFGMKIGYRRDIPVGCRSHIDLNQGPSSKPYWVGLRNE